MVPVPLAYAHLKGSGPASNYSLRGGCRRLIAWATAQPSVSFWQISSERWRKASEETTQRLLLLSVSGMVSLCYCTATHLHSPLRDNEDRVALQNWNVVHKQSRPALLSHPNTERDSTTTCTKPCWWLWMFRQEWALQYRLSIPYTVVYCRQFSFTFVRTN